MKRFVLSLFCAFLFLMSVARACEEGPEYNYKSTLKECPADVQSFMDRINECGHWAGETPYDKERGADIKQAWDRLKCDYLGCDFDALLKKYDGNGDIKKVINDYSRQVWGDPPDFTPCDFMKKYDAKQGLKNAD